LLASADLELARQQRKLTSLGESLELLLSDEVMERSERKVVSSEAKMYLAQAREMVSEARRLLQEIPVTKE
jgi:hypothetical protein